MGARAKKQLMKKVKKSSSDFAKKKQSSSDLSVSGGNEVSGFLPLEGGPVRKLPKGPDTEPMKDTATVLYIGRIPHGFYEDQMEGFFRQFGEIKNLRIARNKKTGKSKHYGFIEFESPEVAKIVADCMHNYLLYEHMLQVVPIPPERVHPKLWKGATWQFDPFHSVKVERKRHDKVRTVEEHRRLVEGILKRDKKRRQRIQDAGVDYECPEIVGSFVPAAKKIKFEEEGED